MSFFNTLSEGIRNHFDQKNEQRQMMEELQREADAQKLMAFREAFAENAKQVAIAEAKREAAELSGLKKLRATSRARNLVNQETSPGTFFDKLSDWTKKNKARMQSNLERTAEIRKVAEEEKLKRQMSMVAKREERMQRSSTLAKPNWGR